VDQHQLPVQFDQHPTQQRDRLPGGLVDHTDGPTTLAALKRIRARYRRGVGIFVVLDNLSAHFTLQIRAWATANRVRLVPTPTYTTSYLNRIECHFWAFVEFVIRGSDYASHVEFAEATRAYLRHRNAARHDSPIRILENRRKAPRFLPFGQRDYYVAMVNDVGRQQRTLTNTPIERITSTPTVARDLRERPSAQRLPAFR